MRISKILGLLFLSSFCLNVFAQKSNYQKETFLVSGNCEMCKKKIEKAAKSVDGIKTAKWNVLNSKMKVKFDANKTTSDAIQSAIALVGYDTENYRAKDEVYENLHYCCKYERTIKK